MLFSRVLAPLVRSLLILQILSVTNLEMMMLDHALATLQAEPVGQEMPWIMDTIQFVYRINHRNAELPYVRFTF